MSDLAKMNEERRVWIDLEHTGVGDPKAGAILEIAVIVTDREFNELGCICTPVFPTKTLYDGRGLLLLDGTSPARVEVGATVRKMHTDNGLFEELRARRALPLDMTEDYALRLIAARGAEQSPLCGSSVGFDREWLAEHMPRLAKALHYRTFDVSGLRIAAQSIGCEFPKRAEGVDQHRALGDIRASIQLAKDAIRMIGEAKR